MGTTRQSWKIYVCGAAAVATLLTSTACSPDDKKDGSGAGPGGPGVTASPIPGTVITLGTTTPGTTTPGTTTPGTTTPSHTPGKAPASPTGPGTPTPTPTAVAACTEADLSFAATNEDGEGQPVRHILLTATNTGHRTCNVYGYPDVKLGADAQGLVPVLKDSDPAALSTLAPGEKTYAALLATGGKMDEYFAHTLTVAVQGDKPGTGESKPVDVALPGVDSLAADDGQRVTYWTTAQGLALRFIMSR